MFISNYITFYMFNTFKKKRLLHTPFEQCRVILKDLNLMSVQRCHEWTMTIIDEDDVCVILRDGRKGHKYNSFYEEYPDLEPIAKSYAIEKASQKSCNFTVKDLAIFIDKLFRETYADELDSSNFSSYNKLIRSEESCRIDLIKWGAKFRKNSTRPYFEGHERADVVEHRKKFVEYFFDSKDHYFYPDLHNSKLVWHIPMRLMRILLSHDESTFKSGEILMFRRMFPGLEPFFSKGQGRSIMLSMFIVMP